ncbi:MAG: hypothetical protein EPO61_13525 [Nitrospirae bacterium]|nr:MAG: hypothetical protein EPO61_13525 [Nitrospirota bacterium]
MPLVVLSGCALWSKPEGPTLQEATASQLTQLLKEREAAIQTVKGLFRAQVKGVGSFLVQRMEGAVYYRRPNALRLQGFNQIGGPLFDFIVAEDLYRLRLLASGKTYTGRLGDLQDLGAISKPIQLSLLAMSGAVGTASVDEGDRVALVEDGDRYRLDVLASSDGTADHATPLRRIWFDRQSLQVVQEDRLSQSGQLEATVRFDDFRAVQSSLPGEAGPLLKPFKVMIQDGQGGGALQLTFHEIVPNPVLKPEDLGVVRKEEEDIRRPVRPMAHTFFDATGARS